MNNPLKIIIKIYNESILRKLYPLKEPKVIHTNIFSYENDESDEIEKIKRYNEKIEKL